MKNETPKFRVNELSLITLARDYDDVDKARSLLESLRWPEGPVCPHCKNHNDKPIYKLNPKAGSKTPARAGVYKCGACRKQFTVTVGTMFEDSHNSISTWLKAMFILCSSKKSISSHQLHRMLGVTYKTAWFMSHRIRYAMAPGLPKPKFYGTVEVDETFVGGVGDARTKANRKTPIVALIQRDGDMHTRVVSNVTQKNLRAAINECVDTSAVINTDDSGVYRGKLKAFAGHYVVNHSAKE